MQPQNKRGYLAGCLLAAGVCIVGGLASPLIKFGMQYMPNFYMVALRFTLGLVLYALVFGRRIVRGLKTAKLAPLLLVSFFTMLAFLFSNLALTMTSATNTAFLYSLAVVFTPFIARLLFGQAIDGRIFLIIGVVAVGLYLLCGGVQFAFGLGELLALLCAISSAFNFVLSGRLLGNSDWVLLSFFQVALNCAVFWALALASNSVVPLRDIPAQGYIVILYLGALSCFLLFIFQNMAFKRIPATLVSLIFSSESIVSAAAAYFLLGERLGPGGIIGAGIILAGIVLATLLTARQPLRKRD